LYKLSYPLINLPPIGNSLEQFSQTEKTFDGLEAELVSNDNNYEFSRNLPDRPAWYNRRPVAYLQQIIIKVNLEENEYLIDKYRTPINLLFEINDFIRNFHYHNKKNETKSLIDLCLHVDSLKKQPNQQENEMNNNNNDDNLYLPEFSCLYLSPANFWSNSKILFKNDENILNRLKTNKRHVRDILFGIRWSDFISTIKHNETTAVTITTLAITIAFKNYDQELLQELKLKLQEKFQNQNLNDNKQLINFIHLNYISKSFWYYIPYISLFILLFLYIYISVSKIEFVKSKWGLALAAVAQVIASLFMSVGICSFFGLQPTLNSGEIFTYLVIFIGFENIVVLTKSVVSTPTDLDVRHRIALGLQKESWKITKNLTYELIIIFFGILTMVPVIQEFCAFAYVGLLIDFFMQMIFFVTVLSIDIRRMELSDLNRIKLQQINKDNKLMYKKNDEDDEFKRKIDLNEDFISKNRKNSFLTNKSSQLLYFWARTRIVQRAVMLLCLFWFFLIFYKSLVVVELLNYDVNISKETVDALLPKYGVGIA